MSGRKRRGEGGGSPPSPSGSGGGYRVVEPPKRLVYTWRWENRPSHRVTRSQRRTDHERKGAVSEPTGEGALHNDAGAQGVSGCQVGSEAARQVQGRERARVDVRDRAESERAGARRRDRVRENAEGAGHAGRRDRDVREVVQGIRRTDQANARRGARQDGEVLRGAEADGRRAQDGPAVVHADGPGASPWPVLRLSPHG